ncbi:glycosyl hydrolase family 8 [Mongoliimonas terrestris]|uniref:glycosyl hydrolase family 8 n=1 Tax=Mongoliimonas terrestris TaxID=1709001 RepID=UPI0009495D5E|nr:glycosyl hydrolase family 8 [Mongoliimonas terrestris]
MKALAALGLSAAFLLAAAAPAGHRLAAHVDDGGRGSVTAAEWALYRARFVTADGRVVDDGNGGVSHSEGQGYGMLLALAAGDEATFRALWNFAATRLRRPDGLFAWRYDPAADPPVGDPNTASDGDLLIAYALLRAASAFAEPGYAREALAIAGRLAETVLLRHDGGVVLLPGVSGFGAADRPDGPVVNPSYLVLEAIAAFGLLLPDSDWRALGASAPRFLSRAVAGPDRLPPEWLSVAGPVPVPAERFPAVFGYNALRLPLYLMRAGLHDHPTAAAVAAAWLRRSGGRPAVLSLADGTVTEPLPDPGYRIILAALACARAGTPVPADLARFEPTLYYPSTLHLLTLSHLRLSHKECL